MALALLPLNQVQHAFNDIVTDSPRCIQQLVDYFKSYWMTKVKLSLWNVAELDVRTNNNVEGTCLSFSSIKLLFLGLFLLAWNSRFNKRILRSHPNVWNFIETLKKEEVVSRQLMLKSSSGNQKKKSKAILALELRLKILSARFENNEIDRKRYLEGLSLFVVNKK